jgi:hypothetical protein
LYTQKILDGLSLGFFLLMSKVFILKNNQHLHLFGYDTNGLFFMKNLHG